MLTQGFPLIRGNIFKNLPLLTVSRMINHFCLSNIYSKENSFCLGSPSDFKVCQSSFGLAIFSDSFSSRYCFFFCLIVLSMLRRLDLNLSKSLWLMLDFSAMSLSNHSLLVFIILTVFKGAILLTTSINSWKNLCMPCLHYDISHSLGM